MRPPQPLQSPIHAQIEAMFEGLAGMPMGVAGYPAHEHTLARHRAEVTAVAEVLVARGDDAAGFLHLYHDVVRDDPARAVREMVAEVGPDAGRAVYAISAPDAPGTLLRRLEAERARRGAGPLEKGVTGNWQLTERLARRPGSASVPAQIALGRMAGEQGAPDLAWELLQHGYQRATAMGRPGRGLVTDATTAMERLQRGAAARTRPAPQRTVQG